jgi:hypothetical protein
MEVHEVPGLMIMMNMMTKNIRQETQDLPRVGTVLHQLKPAMEVEVEGVVEEPQLPNPWCHTDMGMLYRMISEMISTSRSRVMEIRWVHKDVLTPLKIVFVQSPS